MQTTLLIGACLGIGYAIGKVSTLKTQIVSLQSLLAKSHHDTLTQLERVEANIETLRTELSYLSQNDDRVESAINNLSDTVTDSTQRITRGVDATYSGLLEATQSAEISLRGLMEDVSGEMRQVHNRIDTRIDTAVRSQRLINRITK